MKKFTVVDGVTIPLNENNKATDKTSFKIGSYTLMIAIGIILVIPYFYMVMKSFMSAEEVVSPVFKFFPSVFKYENYLLFLGIIEETSDGLNLAAGVDINFVSSVWNTMKVAIFNLIAVPLSATFVAFGFARCEFIGKNALFAFMLSTMMLPGVVTQIPLYQFYTAIGWTNTLHPMTIPNITGGGAMYIFLARSFISSLPREIDNAAKIDGAGPIRRYFNITLPLCKPIIIYIMVGVFNSAWGDYYGPLIWAVDDAFPATLAYAVFNSFEYTGANQLAGVRMAVGVIMSIVPTVLFFVFQKQLIEGVAMDGLKG